MDTFIVSILLLPLGLIIPYLLRYVIIKNPIPIFLAGIIIALNWFIVFIFNYIVFQDLGYHLKGLPFFTVLISVVWGFEMLRAQEKENKYSNKGKRKTRAQITQVKNKVIQNDRKLISEIKTVTIDEQEWMIENLDVKNFRNGEIIPKIKYKQDWEQAGIEGKPAWCYHFISSKYYGKKYGKLYNWYAVNDPRGLAPEGWHVPTNVELESLKNIVASNVNSFKAVDQNCEYGIGNNTSGFSAIFVGFCSPKGEFEHLGYDSYFWSSTDQYEEFAYAMNLGNDDRDTFIEFYDKNFGFSVRCVKN